MILEILPTKLHVVFYTYMQNDFVSINDTKVLRFCHIILYKALVGWITGNCIKGGHNMCSSKLNLIV